MPHRKLAENLPALKAELKELVTKLSDPAVGRAELVKQSYERWPSDTAITVNLLKGHLLQLRGVGYAGCLPTRGCHRTAGARYAPSSLTR
jgi:hypothetical protein